MNTPKIYQMTVKHDSGTVKIQTAADSMKEAMQRVSDLEKCPLSAIKQVWLCEYECSPVLCYSNI